jgi:hypothetical protein
MKVSNRRLLLHRVVGVRQVMAKPEAMARQLHVVGVRPVITATSRMIPRATPNMRMDVQFGR